MRETKSPTLLLIESKIRNIIINELDRIGVHYRIFSRIKTSESLKKKIKQKGHYSEEGKKIQDMLGIRIVTYFIDDVNILWSYFNDHFTVVEGVYDSVGDTEFGVVRKNMVCKFPKEDIIELFNDTKCVDDTYKLVDNTFEIQFRTTFSEGWHEVDHLLRYKCKDDWHELKDENRMFNGVFAALETNDRALKALFDDIAYLHYKKCNYEAMMRMKFRLRFTDTPLSQDIIDSTLAKDIIRFDRRRLLEIIAKNNIHLPISYDNIVYIIMALKLTKYSKCEQIPDLVKNELSRCDILKVL